MSPVVSVRTCTVYTIFYAFGSGVITLSYTSECFPLYVCKLGNSKFLGDWKPLVWKVTLAMTWPSFLRALKPQGAICGYAAWNFVGVHDLVPAGEDRNGTSLRSLEPGTWNITNISSVSESRCMVCSSLTTYKRPSVMRYGS